MSNPISVHIIPYCTIEWVRAGCHKFRSTAIENFHRDDRTIRRNITSCMVTADLGGIFSHAGRYSVTSEPALRWFGYLANVVSKTCKNEMLSYLVRDNCVEALKILLEDREVDPRHHNCDAMKFACMYGCIDVVDVLLKYPYADTYTIQYRDCTEFDHGIVAAADRDHVHVVKRLLEDPRVDPSVARNWAMKVACIRNNAEIVELLLNDPRIDPSQLSENWAHNPTIQTLIRNKQTMHSNMIYERMVKGALLIYPNTSAF